jgi:hypothetical protein
VTFTTSLSESCFSDVTTVSSDKFFQSAQRQKPIGQYIPPGIKENVFFVIDDTYNYQRHLSKNQSEYPAFCSMLTRMYGAVMRLALPCTVEFVR